MAGIMSRGWHRGRQESGAAIVEMALLTPFLILLVLGVVESSWLLGRSLDVASAARVAGRMAAVNDGDLTAIAAAMCAGMDDSTGASVSLAGSGNGLGGDVTATVNQPVPTLTGLLDNLFTPPVPIARTTTFHLESTTALWADGSASC